MTAIRQNIGRVGLRMRRAWTDNPLEPYMKMDVVEKDGSSYTSLVDNNTATPPSEQWQLQSARGAVGPGVPSGGTAGQMLTKKGATDFDAEWKTPVDAYSKTEVDTIVAPFITTSVDNLVNYYLKSETYTKAEVAALIGAIQQFHYEIYASTSEVTSPAGNVLYLIGPASISGGDKYEEYVYTNNAFVKIGETSIDLSGYVTTSALNTALADYTTTANLTTLLAGKQDALVFNTAYDATTNKVATMADMPTTMGASGSSHSGGLVPDTPSTAGTTKYLREDGTWAVPAGGGGGSSYVPTLNAAPTSSTTTYIKDGATVDFEIGQFARVAKTGGGYDFYQLYDLQEVSNVTTATWEKTATADYVDGLVGDIATILDNINGEVI